MKKIDVGENKYVFNDKKRFILKIECKCYICYRYGYIVLECKFRILFKNVFNVV